MRYHVGGFLSIDDLTDVERRAEVRLYELYLMKFKGLPVVMAINSSAKNKQLDVAVIQVK